VRKCGVFIIGRRFHYAVSFPPTGGASCSNGLVLPFLILVGSFVALWLAGLSGISWLNNWVMPLRIALALMFFLTASGHWGKLRGDLIRMAPPWVPDAGLAITITGILEILGAIGLLIPQTAKVAATCLAVLLVAMFPANVQAARQGLTIGGRKPAPLPIRALLQLIFITALLVAGWH
jgi:uncharacterized membrane protein